MAVIDFDREREGMEREGNGERGMEREGKRERGMEREERWREKGMRERELVNRKRILFSTYY